MRKTIHVSGFPHMIAAEEIKRFLERYTGEGTVDALEVKPWKRGSRAYARVQFSSSRGAEIIIDLANTHLYYGSPYLKAWEQENDVVPSRRTFMHEMDGITLNFGCQISKESFSVLWRAKNVSVKFGAGLKKMHFHLSHNSVDYRLQLSYESIWRIMLYNSHGQSRKLLLIQLYGAPRIYKKLNMLNGSIYSFFKETPDDHWMRTTDFTPSYIGQSSALCLQLPHGMKLPNFKSYFVYYDVSEAPFTLESGVPFCDQSLVPIVQPPGGGYELPYRLLFKVCNLVQTGCLPGMKLDTRFFRIVNPLINDLKFIEHALEKLYYLKECCYDPVSQVSNA